MSTATSPRTRTAIPTKAAGPVVVAVDDDGNAGALLRRGRELADQLGVPLRVIHIWSDGRPPYCSHHRRCHRDIGEAIRLVNGLVDEHLSEAGTTVERDVAHDSDPVSALADVSAGASALVMGASSEQDASTGGTADAVLVRVRCPVAVVSHRPRSITQSAW